MTRLNQPEFFLIGAPKCGTSAISQYLADHPNVCFSYPKEPYFWAADFPGIRHQFGVETLDAYLALFSAMNRVRTMGGEGSTIYLASETAVKSILEFRPDARFLVMLRNPMELVVSAHLQELSHLNECELSFEAAWQLQVERSMGRSLPPGCYEPQLLQYHRMALLGFQVERLFRTVSQDQVHVVYFDDLKSSIAEVYSGVVDFLGLPHDGRTEFPRVNDTKLPRYRWVTRLLNGRMGTGVSRFLKRRLPSPVAGLLDNTKKLLVNRSVVKSSLSPEFSEHLQEIFLDDILLLQECTKRNLSKWLQPVKATGS